MSSCKKTYHYATLKDRIIPIAGRANGKNYCSHFLPYHLSKMRSVAFFPNRTEKISELTEHNPPNLKEFPTKPISVRSVRFN